MPRAAREQPPAAQDFATQSSYSAIFCANIESVDSVAVQRDVVSDSLVDGRTVGFFHYPVFDSAISKNVRPSSNACDIPMH